MYRLCLIATLALSPALALAQTAPTTLSCDGAFAKDSDYARIVKIFGAANVTDEKIHSVGVGEIKATVIYGKDAKRRLEVVWKDEKARKNPFVMAKGADSAWKTEDGIGGGASVADIEKLNGKPFKLYGFEWDNGGLVSNFNGGALAKRKGGCFLGLSFSPPDDVGAELYKVSGDKEFLSSDRNMRAVKPYLWQITIGWQK